MTGLTQDIRFAFRQLRKSHGFTAVAVLTLALGIGANTAIFSVVDAVLLRPLPFHDPKQLVNIYEDAGRSGGGRLDFAPANYVDVKKQTDAFEDVAAVDENGFNLTAPGTEPQQLTGEMVTWNLFSLLGVRPLRGRVFLPEEDRPGFEHEVLLSHRLWRERFGENPGVLGTDVFLNGAKYSVVGIMPPDFSFPDKDADVWIPRAFTARHLASRDENYLFVYGRLRPGVSVKQANAELLGLCNRLKQQTNVMRFVDAFVAEPLQLTYTRASRSGLILLTAAVAFILLIGCANLANLLLARMNTRRREIALREALGASRQRVIRGLLSESLLLAFAGGTLGILLAYSLFRVLGNLIPADLSRTVTLSLNWTILAGTLLLSLASVLLFGLAPALRASGRDTGNALKDGGRGSTGARGKLANWLIVGEVALSIVLLAASGLLLKTFERLRYQDPGFRSDHVLTLGIPYSLWAEPDFNRESQFIQTVLERLRTLPGVKSVGSTSVLPLTWKGGGAGFRLEGPILPGIDYSALDRVVSPGYFETMRIPLRRGRFFTDADRPNGPFVAVVNETMARRFWPDQDALGRRIGFDMGGSYRWFQIVGVVGDVKQMGLNVPPKEEMYFPYWQAQGNYMRATSLVIRTANDPTALAGTMRRAIWSIDPNQPVSEVTTMEGILDQEVNLTRMQTTLLGGLAGLALVLACVGIYGVMSFLVGQRSPEMAIRMAVGATKTDILGLVIGGGMKLALAGICIGVIAGLGAARLLASLLYGVSPADAFTFVAVAILLASTAMMACYIPARRAANVDPMVALRCE
jgi:putative ABC transport system permease protein